VYYTIVYFTRTGTSKRIAEKIGHHLPSKIVRLSDNVNWDGFIGYVKSAYYTITKKSVTINLSESIDDANPLIVVTPLWDAHPCPAVLELLKTVPANKVHLVTTANVSLVKHPEIYQSVHQITKRKDNEDEMIKTLAEFLSAQESK
jgi:hypothetical protein